MLIRHITLHTSYFVTSRHVTPRHRVTVRMGLLLNLMEETLTSEAAAIVTAFGALMRMLSRTLASATGTATVAAGTVLPVGIEVTLTAECLRCPHVDR